MWNLTRVVWWCGVGSIAACGRVGYDGSLISGAGPHDGGPGDGAVDARTAVNDGATSGSDGGPDGGVAAAGADADAGALGCPASYSISGVSSGSTYRYLTVGASWLAANADCIDDGATTHLVVVSSDAELGEVADAVASDSVWLGLSDRRTPDVFLWVTAEDTGGFPAVGARPWAGPDPSGEAGADCVLFHGATQRLDDRDCALARPYLCECDGLTADPDRY